MIKKLNLGKPLFKWLTLISVFVSLFATIDEVFDENDRAFGSLTLEYLVSFVRTFAYVFILYGLVSSIVSLLNKKLPWLRHSYFNAILSPDIFCTLAGLFPKRYAPAHLYAPGLKNDQLACESRRDNT